MLLATGLIGSGGTPTPTPTPALTLDTLKQWLRYEAEDGEQDIPLTLSLRAAIRHVESQTGHLFTQRMVTQPVYALSGRVSLFYGPRTGNVALNYADSSGAPQTAIVTGFVGNEMIAPTGGWPAASQPVTATYMAGYANPEDVPEDLLIAVLLLAGNWDANREASVTGASSVPLPFGIEALLMPYRTLLA